MRTAATVVALVAAMGGAARAETPPPPPDPELSLVVLAGFGRSFALGERRVANLAPPSSEVRLGLRRGCAPWAVFEVALGGVVFPELVPTVGLGLRLHPLGRVPVARHGFVRAGVTALGSIDGFDLAVAGEAGVAITRQRLIGWLGVGGDRYLVAPRLVVQVRVGVGVIF